MKQTVCRFCGADCLYSKISKRIYEADGHTLHVENCPKRAQHYHEKALDMAEEKRQCRFGEYNREGTETSEGCRLAEGMTILAEPE